MSAEFLTVIVMFVGSNAMYAWWARTASKERRSIINACLARTPAEFELMQFEDNTSKKVKKAKAEAAAIPPIGL